MLLKLESLQVTGSFKVRGAANALLRLESTADPVVACSSGNHGRAVAWMAGRLRISATVCVPDWTDPVKVAGMEQAGATVIRAGPTYDEAEEVALAVARGGATLIHPFDDPAVIEGQGTVAVEILADCGSPARVVVPLSGGGLAAGIALHLAGTGTRIVAASARAANVMRRSLEAGRPLAVPEENTLATALSGGIGLDNRHTFRAVRDHVHEHVEVDEEAIADAMRWAFRHGLVVEGGGAVALAAWRSGALPAATGPTVLVVSGGNVASETLHRILGEGRSGRETNDGAGPEGPAPRS